MDPAYKIEKGVPPPTNVAATALEQIRQCEVGDSFLIERRLLTHYHSAANRAGLKIKTKKNPEDPATTRVWRVA
jgi:hypothetical protein